VERGEGLSYQVQSGIIRPLSEETFNRFRALIYQTTNINLRESKQILVSNRLRKRILALNLSGYDEYYEYLTRSENRDEELPHFMAAVSTNETYFFREPNHFSALEESILPELFSSKKRLRVWTAGCSSGEEPYTLRIVFEEGRHSFCPGEAEIVATDISRTAIAEAQEGVYMERSLRFVPPMLLKRYFVAQEGGAFRVAETLRKSVDFRVHNLLKEAPPKDQFDIIFCRNVMIYFDKLTQKRLVDEYFAEALDPRGYLCIGHSESLTGASRKFEYVRGLRAPVYRKTEEKRT
jgi:chemotaxis protein methyltransferase CheR